MKELLKRGFDFIRNNPTIISSILLIFIVVGSLFFNSYVTLKRFQDSMDKTLRSKAVLAEDILNVSIEEYLSIGFDENIPKIQEKFNKIKEKDGEISELTFFVQSLDQKKYIPLISTADMDEVRQLIEKDKMGENARKFALSVDDAFAYVSNDGSERFWNIVKAARDSKGDVIGVMLFKLSLAEPDALSEKTILQSYGISLVAAMLVLVLIFNHIRLFSFEIRAKKLEEVDKMKDDFISMASHELKSPLTAVRGYAELLEDSLSGKNQGINLIAQRKYLSNINISVDRLKNLVEDLLEVSRLQQNRIPIEARNIDLKEMIEKMLGEMKVMADQKGLMIKNSVGEISLALADPERTKQILINLISNAIKYTPQGSVEVQVKEDQKNVFVTVADTGLGISSGDMKNLFSKFYRVKNDKTKDISGTGLGLWIAKEMAEKMGGDLTAESMEGVGSRFTLKLKKAN